MIGIKLAKWLVKIAFSSVSVVALAQTSAPIQSWVDQDTQHKIVQLTPEPNSRGLYFNVNAFTPDDSQMIYTVGGDIHVVDLHSYKTRLLVAGPVDTTNIIVGHITPTVYFMRPNDTGLYSVRVDNGQIVKIQDLPPHTLISSLNSTETLAAGVYVEGDGLEKLHHPPDPKLKESSIRAAQMEERLAAHLPNVLFTINLQNGEMNKVLESNDWINHVQFSPKDPTLLMYCHEGLWWKVDRIWTVRVTGAGNQLIHRRTVNDEIAGHEFWDPDGVTIWYDLQIPRGQNFYLASYNTSTGARHWYSVQRDAWSIHYNVAADDSVFCGDGGDYAQVAKSKNGQWIELFKKKENPVPTEIDQSNLIQSGFTEPRHLVNMANQDYRLEPNVRFSPDQKWVIFTGNMTGKSYVYAVEVAKTQATNSQGQ